MDMENLPTQTRGILAGSRQASVFGVSISFMVVTAVVIALRIYVRKVLIRAVGADDSKMIFPPKPDG
jgi:hypothetical protein